MTETEKPYKMSLTEEMRKHLDTMDEAWNKAELNSKPRRMKPKPLPEWIEPPKPGEVPNEKNP